MWDVADIIFSLRRQLSHWYSRPVNPAYWVMNIDIGAWCHPTLHERTRQGVRLQAKYPLIQYVCPEWYWARLESLFILNQLDAMELDTLKLPLGNNDTLIWLDVGSKNGGYFPALCAMASTLSPRFHITGVEVDAYRFYEDAATRAGYGKGMAEALHPHVTFVEADFCKWQPTFGCNKAHIISCFLPFLHVETHKAWGLPATVFNPLQHFNSMWQALAPGGVLLLSNLNAHEAAMQHELIERWMAQEPDTAIHPILELKALSHPTAFLKTREDTRTLWKLRKPLSAS
jgi:SAM-dependent methyltransferase